jgi:hypothetical protein
MKFDICVFFEKKPIENMKISLKSNKNSGYFTWMPICIYDHVTLCSCYNKKFFGQYLHEQSKYILYSIFFFRNLYLGREDHNLKIRTAKQRTDVGKYSFVNRTIKSWNQLPACLLASFPSKLNTFWKKIKLQTRGLKWGLSVNKWSDVRCSDVELKFLGTKVPCTLGWPYTESIWLYCDYFVWCVSCTAVVLACFVICGVFVCVYVWVL